MSSGGARPGAGKPKGSKHKKTIEREIALKELQQRILEEIRPLLRAQLDTAKGLTVMFQRKKLKNHKTGKYERTGEMVRVQDLNRIEELLEGDCTGDDWYYITTKDPNVKALEDLFNRVFGKPKESIELAGSLPSNIIINVVNEEFNKAKQRIQKKKK